MLMKMPLKIDASYPRLSKRVFPLNHFPIDFLLSVQLATSSIFQSNASGARAKQIRYAGL